MRFSIDKATGLAQERIAGVPLHDYAKIAISRALPGATFGPTGLPVPGDAALLTAKMIRDPNFPAAIPPRYRVTTPWDLARASKILALRAAKRWALAGVFIENPETTVIGPYVTIEPGARIEGHTRLLGVTHLATGATIRWGTTVEDATVQSGATVGPYANLRPGTQVGADCKIGNFVELKNTSIGPKTAIAHLSYLGDATVGARVNIGCGFITCNYDGRVKNGQRKHKTVIEDDAFLGSDCQAIAPIRIGRGAYVASGSTLTNDVPPGSLAIARSRQMNKPGYAEKFREPHHAERGP